MNIIMVLSTVISYAVCIGTSTGDFINDNAYARGVCHRAVDNLFCLGGGAKECMYTEIFCLATPTFVTWGL